jgi:hypothetical protein
MHIAKAGARFHVPSLREDGAHSGEHSKNPPFAGDNFVWQLFRRSVMLRLLNKKGAWTGLSIIFRFHGFLP